MLELRVQPGLLRSPLPSGQFFPVPNLLHSALSPEKAIFSCSKVLWPSSFVSLTSHTSHLMHPHPTQATFPCPGCLSRHSGSVLLRYKYLYVHIYIYWTDITKHNCLIYSCRRGGCDTQLFHYSSAHCFPSSTKNTTYQGLPKGELGLKNSHLHLVKWKPESRSEMLIACSVTVLQTKIPSSLPPAAAKLL